VADPVEFRLGAGQLASVCALFVKTAWRRLGDGGGLR
jgi:hypothetical protein